MSKLFKLLDEWGNKLETMDENDLRETLKKEEIYMVEKLRINEYGQVSVIREDRCVGLYCWNIEGRKCNESCIKWFEKKDETGISLNLCGVIFKASKENYIDEREK